MGKGRLEAFSDGVIAIIIITIMVLELKPPHEQSLDALRPLLPAMLGYVLSFIFVGIYWNNHHHLMQTARRVSGAALWANLHLLFWLSLIPFLAGWLGESHFAPWPIAADGVVLLMTALAWRMLCRKLVQCHSGHSASELLSSVGWGRKANASLSLYMLGITLALVASALGPAWTPLAWAGCAAYVIVAAIWFVPDRSLEHAASGASPD
jgi:uncharacterized membrane protein